MEPTMTSEMNASATSERELTSDEIDTISGGAAADNGEDYDPGAHIGAAVSAALAFLTSFFGR
jgi:hypothetical protein